MSEKTITKFFSFVISFSIVCLIFSGCRSASSSGGRENNPNSRISNDYAAPRSAGKIESDEIKESSGLAASRCQTDVFWTHNDSGDDAFIFAFNSKGKKLGTWKVQNAKNDDWEAMATYKNAAGECFLYLGDIGNNERLKTEFTIYRLPEPTISAADKSSTKKNPLLTENAEAVKGEYPDMRHDAETLLVHPQTGDIYILSKRISGSSSVYKLSAGYSLDKVNSFKKISDFSVPAIPDGLLTGGDISPDGQRIVICDYFDAYELVLPAEAKNFDDIWQQKLKIVKLGKREQGEAVAYSADGNSIFATSEKKNQPFIEVRRK